MYAELYRIARGHLRNERSDHTLQLSALVHEAYLRLFGSSMFASPIGLTSTPSSRTMRRILVDHAQARSTARRSGAGERVDTSIEVKASGAGH